MRWDVKRLDIEYRISDNSGMLYRNANGIPREIVMHVAQRLSRRGIKQQEIAQMLACSQSTVSTWLKSLNQPPEYLDHEAVEDIVRSLMESRP